MHICSPINLTANLDKNKEYDFILLSIVLVYYETWESVKENEHSALKKWTKSYFVQFSDTSSEH